MRMCQRQSGNALFLILIAVALFAALSYALTQSSRSGGSGIQKETDTLLAAQITQIGASLRTATQRLMLTVPINSIRYHAAGDPNQDAPCTETDGTCLFTPQSGGMTWPTIPAAALADPPTPWVVISDPAEDAGLNLIGSSAVDGVMFMVGLSENVCKAINKGLGIDHIIVPDSHALDNVPSIVWTAGEPNPAAACVEATWIQPGLYAYYHVLSEWGTYINNH